MTLMPSMNLRWFISPTVRHACAAHKHYRHLLAAQRDRLELPAIAAMTEALLNLQTAIAEGHPGKMNVRAEELQFAAGKWLRPYPHAVWRENVEVLLVAISVAMAIRTFFLQPFKIPTGSMQPTLFGVTSAPDFSQSTIRYWLRDSKPAVFAADVTEQVHLRDSLQIPGGLRRFVEWLEGNSYIHVVAKTDGVIGQISPVSKLLFINLSQTIWINGVAHTIWFPPDTGEQTLADRAGLTHDHVYHQGEDVVKMKVSAGDHLFVDRLTYNFRKPERGEIVVFATVGTKIREQDEFYIKRLTVLPGERVRIGDDRHMRIDGRRLDATTPHFEKVYGFAPNELPRDSHYSGHLNNTTAAAADIWPGIAPYFPDQDTVFTNGPDTYMVFGDNTCNSSDSRFWGTFPAQNIIGKASFIYWPLTARWGWGER